MNDILVVGGGPIGFATAMLFARDGHDVTVLERDSEPTPTSDSEAWTTWQRKGVAQFRSAHYLQAKVRHLLDDEFPDVRDALVASGAKRHSLLGGFGATGDDTTPRDGDDRFETLTARRPVVERAFACVGENTPRVKVERGVTVQGPVTNGALRDGVPHVVGVRTGDGAELRADLVVDAMGRRSKIGDWITGIGGRAPYEEASDAGFAYYTRHYRSRDGSFPEVRGSFFALLSTVSMLTLPTDADTWVVVIVCAAGDGPLKEVRRNEVWEKVARSVPHVAHWLDGVPIQDVYPMAGVLDRYRRFVVDDSPVVTGLVAVGDSWACTNPQAGRGIATGLRQAVALRDVVRECPDDPPSIAMAYDRVTEETCAPWYRTQVVRDRARHAVVQAAIDGREPPVPTDPGARTQAALATAAAFDADIARDALEIFGCLTPADEVLGRPGLLDKVRATAEGRQLPLAEGPTRAQLLALLSH